jgi:hypothetical protein
MTLFLKQKEPVQNCTLHLDVMSLESSGWSTEFYNFNVFEDDLS